jgi:hypothetical protein
MSKTVKRREMLNTLLGDSKLGVYDILDVFQEKITFPLLAYQVLNHNSTCSHALYEYNVLENWRSWFTCLPIQGRISFEVWAKIRRFVILKFGLNIEITVF